MLFAQDTKSVTYQLTLGYTNGRSNRQILTRCYIQLAVVCGTVLRNVPAESLLRVV